MIFSKASGLNNSVFGKSQDPIRMFLQEEEEAYKAGSQIDKVFAVVDSDKYGEKFSELTSKGDFQDVGEGGAYPRTSQQVGYEKLIEPEEWKNSFEVTETMIEDGKMFDIKANAKDFSLSYARTREKFGAMGLQYGNATTFTFNGKVYAYTCRDGLAFFSTAHTSKTGGTGTQSNYSTAYTFSYDNLCLVEEAMQKFTDHDGNLLNIQPDTIVIPNNAAIKKLVADAVFTGGDGNKPGTADAGFNFHGSRWNVVVWNQLSKLSATNDPWFVCDSKRNQIDGLIWIDRVPLSVRSWLDDETGNNVWGGRSRFGMGAVNWVSWYGCVPA
ncbi:MAG: phage major capsid protein [Thermincolia bacterium]